MRVAIAALYQLHSKEKKLSMFFLEMLSSAICVRLRRQPNAMDRQKKSINSTQANNIGAYKCSFFNQRTEKRHKDKQSADDSKGTSKTYDCLLFIGV